MWQASVTGHHSVIKYNALFRAAAQINRETTRATEGDAHRAGCALSEAALQAQHWDIGFQEGALHVEV